MGMLDRFKRTEEPVTVEEYVGREINKADDLDDLAKKDKRVKNILKTYADEMSDVANAHMMDGGISTEDAGSSTDSKLARAQTSLEELGYEVAAYTVENY